MLRKFVRKCYPLLIIIGIVTFWLLANALWHTPPKKTLVAQFDSYSILKAKDQYYLRIHESADILPRTMSAIPLTSIPAEPTPSFSSAQEMKNRILGGKLSQTALYYLWKHCPFDGDNDFYICNLDEIREPTPPDGMPLNEVFWYGTYYVFSYYVSSDYSMHFRCYKLTKEHNAHTAFDHYIDGREEDIYKTEQIPGQNATVYYYQHIEYMPPSKMVLYDLSTDNKTLMIFEIYRNESWSVPSSIEFCGIENGVYFKGHITSTNERPTLEFLQNLGISPEPIP